ncbi:MAG TPA: hypothetical protein VHE55_09670 [Fimbriimonadaceae bacterium]|nr:hypothetical protein [Fimbriimonadaceae bacterium]
MKNVGKLAFGSAAMFLVLSGCGSPKQASQESLPTTPKPGFSPQGTPPDRLQTPPQGAPSQGTLPGTPPGSTSQPPTKRIESSGGSAVGQRVAPPAPANFHPHNGPPRPFKPTMPKADETVTGSYKLGDQAQVEVAGICKITEDSVGCWDSNGGADEDLTKKVKESLEKEASQWGGGGSQVPVRYGKKNRLIVFKMTERVFDRRPSGYLSIQWVGNSLDFSGGGIMMGMDRPSIPTTQNPYQVRYETRSVVEDAGATSTKARLCLTTPLDETATIDCRPGATAKFGGETYTIVSVGKPTDESMAMRMQGDRKGKMWVVKLKATHNSVKPITINLTALDASGQVVRYADLQGNPVTDKQYMEEMRKRQDEMMKPGAHQAFINPYQMAIGYGISRSGDGEQTEMLYVDPAKVSKFQIHGQVSKFIDLTGIPLDPR